MSRHGPSFATTWYFYADLNDVRCLKVTDCYTNTLQLWIDFINGVHVSFKICQLFTVHLFCLLNIWNNLFSESIWQGAILEIIDVLVEVLIDNYCTEGLLKSICMFCVLSFQKSYNIDKIPQKLHRNIMVAWRWHVLVFFISFPRVINSL